MKKILFVDDEPSILAGLSRMLHRYRKDWDMSFVEGGRQATVLMDKEPFDVVVSDMRMPEIDGAALLEHVQDRYPRTVRIVLSGHAEQEAALRVIPIAHQFLAKPCESERIRETITRACDLHALMENVALQALVGRIDTLPAAPSVHNALVAAMSDPEVGLTDIAAIVEKDIGIAAKILQIVNSSFFGVARRIDSLRDATSYLGMNMIRNLTLSMEIFRAFEGRSLPDSFSIEKKQDHALMTARIARDLVEGKGQSDSAFLAGMLHDVGALILATSYPEAYSECISKAVQSGVPLHEVEAETHGASHAEAGAYLLGLWGIPYGIVEAVAHHHHPSRVDARTFDILGAVHVADALAHDLAEPHKSVPGVNLDLGYLEAIGVLDKVPTWREAAKKQLCGDDTEAA